MGIFNKKGSKFYSLKNILKKQAQYYLIFGERSSGKTFATLELILKNYWKKGEQGAYIRRWGDDIKGIRGSNIWSGLIDADKIREITNGEYEGVVYKGRAFYLARFNEKLQRMVPSEEPFCYIFAISEDERIKGANYPRITTVVFDEFMTRSYYLPNEFKRLLSIVSTIARQRDNIKIFLLGNTVNEYCPYFEEFGINHIVKTMQPGDIREVAYEDRDAKVVLEWTEPNVDGKASDIYFEGFDKSGMITTGKWETLQYPATPYSIKEEMITFKFYINFNDEVMQGDVVENKDDYFIHIHKKTTDIKDEYPIYQLDFDPSPQYYTSLTRGRDKCSGEIAYLINSNKIFVQNNRIGEMVRNYIMMSENRSILNYK